MFDSETLFIIGAGASCEVGMPLGSDLKQLISSHLNLIVDGRGYLNGDGDILQAIRQRNTQVNSSEIDLNSFREAALHIREAMPQAPSIDNFIYAQTGDPIIEFCSKIAIGKSIIEGEYRSPLYIPESNRKGKILFDDIEKTWLSKFFQLLCLDCSKKNIEELFSNVSFVIFNYDRCLEHHLFYALQNYYRVSPEYAATILNRVNFIHPYGSLGKLPWQETNESVPYGGIDGQADLGLLAARIKTFSEEMEDTSHIKKVKSLLKSADKMVFLGFAFHEQNMKLMKTFFSSIAEEVYATTHGISKNDQEIVRAQISKYFFDDDETITRNLLNCTCSELFDNYWRSISAEVTSQF
jgi:hypothetical protein